MDRSMGRDDQAHGDVFGARLRSLRRAAGLTQTRAAALLGLSSAAIRSWEGGRRRPATPHLRALIAVLMRGGAFTRGRERDEIIALWALAHVASPRTLALDRVWFDRLLAAGADSGGATRGAPMPPALAAASATLPVVPSRGVDWGEAPAVANLHGRAGALALLEGWAEDGDVLLTALVGMGGIGKTCLALTLARRLAPRYDRVVWRSLRNAPALPDLLVDLLGALAEVPDAPPSDLEERLARLVALLAARRCLLVLDNLESVLPGDGGADRDPRGYTGYGLLLRRVAQAAHRSLVVVTGREKPPEVGLLEGEGGPVRTLALDGLDVRASRALLAGARLVGTDAEWVALVRSYAGNPLALKIVAETVRELFGGDLAAFLSAGQIVFDGIRALLDQQVGRLSDLERAVLVWLAVTREPLAFAALAVALEPAVERGAAFEALGALRRRSLIERGERGGTFTLQPVVLEYVTEQLVRAVVAGLREDRPTPLVRHALVQAHARDYVRHSQERLIAAPLLTRLSAEWGGAAVERRLVGLLEAWRGRPRNVQGYGPGNVVNLLRLWRGHLRGLDLSRLSIRQAYLQEVDAQDTSLAHAHLDQVVLAGAFDFVPSVALDAAGAYLAGGTTNGEVRLWRVADRTLLWSLQGHTGQVYSVALSADGRLVASGADDGTVRLYTARTGEPVAILRGHTSAVWGVALSADGRLAASAGADGTAWLWDTDAGRPLATLRGHSGPVYAVALAADGRLLATGADDGMINLWATPGGDCLATLTGHTSAVWAVALSADGRLAASGGADGTVRLWDADAARLLATLEGHTGPVYGVALSADGRVAVSGGVDGTVRLWATPGGERLATLQGHTGMVRGVALSADGRLPASGGTDGVIRLWEASSGRLLTTFQGHTSAVWSVALAGDGRIAASGGDDGMVRLWETAGGACLAAFQGHRGSIWGVALSADGRLLASSGFDGTVRVWGTARAQDDPALGDGACLAVLRGHGGGAWGVALSGDGRLVASGDGEGVVRLWATGTGDPLAVLRGHSGLVWGVALSADGRLVASGGSEGMVRLWETAGGTCLAVLHGHAGVVWGVALSADGTLVASGGVDGTVRLWATGTGDPLAVLRGHSGVVWDVALSADGRLVASGGADGTVRLWETAGGTCLAVLHGHTSTVLGVALAADGTLVAGGSQDGTVRLWATNGGGALGILRPDRLYERLDITGLTGVTAAQRAALRALGAVDARPGQMAAPHGGVVR